MREGGVLGAGVEKTAHAGYAWGRRRQAIACRARVRPVRGMGVHGVTRGEGRPGTGIGAWPWQSACV